MDASASLSAPFTVTYIQKVELAGRSQCIDQLLSLKSHHIDELKLQVIDISFKIPLSHSLKTSKRISRKHHRFTDMRAVPSQIAPQKRLVHRLCVHIKCLA